MKDTRYLLLIHKSFDVQLSDREQYELSGYLDGNKSAAELFENLKSLVAESSKLELPENLRPQEPKQLFQAITAALSMQKQPSIWVTFVRDFVRKAKPAVKTIHVDETEIARLKSGRLPASTQTRRANKLDKVREKVGAETTRPARCERTLAEVIRQQIVARNENDQNPAQQTATAANMYSTFSVPDQLSSPLPEDPVSISTENLRSTGQNHSAESAENAVAMSQVPVQSPAEAAMPPTAANSALPTSMEPVPLHQETEQSESERTIRPASRIPVADIIAHVSNIFSDSRTAEPESPPRPSAGEPEDPWSTGNWTALNTDQATTFGRLSGAENTTSEGGRIAAIGKFLLDKKCEQAIGGLINAGVTLPTARMLTEEEAHALSDCLEPIQRLPGVAGCIVLGYDGMIITTTLPQQLDSESFAAWALLTYMSTHGAIGMLGHNNLRQLVSRTRSGYLLLADFGQGLLLAVSDNASSEAILPLMRNVRRITAA